MAKKLPATADWQNYPVEKWNTTTFRYYIGHLHEENWGIPYMPFGTWKVEMAKIKQAIDEYGAPMVRDFVDECIRTYQSSAAYPGINFGFMLTYRKNILQRLIMEAAARTQREQMVTDTDPKEFEW